MPVPPRGSAGDPMFAAGDESPRHLLNTLLAGSSGACSPAQCYADENQATTNGDPRSELLGEEDNPADHPN